MYATTGADTCVPPLLASYSAASDEAFATALQLYSHLSKYAHCIVMPAADRSLLEVIYVNTDEVSKVWSFLRLSFLITYQGTREGGAAAADGGQPRWDQVDHAQHRYVPGLLPCL